MRAGLTSPLPMAVDSGTLKSLIKRELECLQDARVLGHIRELLVEPEVVFRAWDYGKPGEKYPCWTVLEHAPSETGIAYCEYGFGPRCPWGLVWLEANEKRGCIGMDSGWYTSLLDVYFESLAAAELPIWRVFKETSSWPGEPVTEEGSWDVTWERVEQYRTEDPASRYHHHHSIAYKRCP
jgi:hypothetical protein